MVILLIVERTENTANNNNNHLKHYILDNFRGLVKNYFIHYFRLVLGEKKKLFVRENNSITCSIHAAPLLTVVRAHIREIRSTAIGGEREAALYFYFFLSLEYQRRRTLKTHTHRDWKPKSFRKFASPHPLTRKRYQFSRLNL